MPLPDERPRQSVANLIGRFEQQGKRQATPPVPAVPRSSSVSSQIAGDAAKEELKEKREWPPKPVASADIKSLAPTLSSPPSSSMSGSPVLTPQPIPDPAPPTENPTTPTPASPEAVMSPLSKGKATATGKTTPTTGTRRPVTLSPAKPRSPVANSSSVKVLASSSPKTSLQSSVSQPLRSQHTGQSVPSHTSATRQARPVPRTAPSTPSRPKSSAAQNKAVARPKTPSSGLFAPTAASLARSRNAPPPPPPPVKKVTLSSDSAERLSKPTAASLSKARAPATPAPSPARIAKSISTGAHTSTPRGPSKLKVGRIPGKKEANTKDGIRSGPALVASQPPHEFDHPMVDHMENGHESGIAAFPDVGSPEHGHSEVVSDATHDPAADEQVHPDPGVHPEEQQAGEHPVKDETHQHEHVAQTPPEEVAHEHEQVHSEGLKDSVPNPTEFHSAEITSNGDGLEVGPHASGNDLEDIVNLLEGVSVPKTRPQSIITIPDEIPDEY